METPMSGQPLKDLMEYTAGDLPPLPDLVPGAVVLGRRRRNRRRMAVTLSAVAVVAVAALAVPAALPDGKASGARPASGPVADTPRPTYAVIPEQEADKPGVDSLPPMDKVEVQEFKQLAADVLHQVLPPALGEIRLLNSHAAAFRAVAGDKTYEITFGVDAPFPGSAPMAPTCEPSGRIAACAAGTLPDGTPVTAERENTGDGTQTVNASFPYRGKLVYLFILPSGFSGPNPPVTAEQLLAAVQDARFVEFLDYAVANPLNTPPPVQEPGAVFSPSPTAQ